jgi:hypothetical protein
MLLEHDAAGLVLFNRLMEPDIDLLNIKMTDTLELSDSVELRLPLLWSALLAGRTKGSLPVSNGVRNVDDVVKSLFAGADVVMTTSALLRSKVEPDLVIIAKSLGGGFPISDVLGRAKIMDAPIPGALGGTWRQPGGLCCRAGGPGCDRVSMAA